MLTIMNRYVSCNICTSIHSINQLCTFAVVECIGAYIPVDLQMKVAAPGVYNLACGQCIFVT